MLALRQVLVATDFSECSDRAVAQARELASRFGATLHVLHVVTEPMREMWSSYAPGAEFLEIVHRLEAEACRRIERQMAASGVQPGRPVISTAWGDAAEQILKYAASRRIELIVCGTHGRHGWDHVMMGSVAERLVRLAPCPVLTVHAAERGESAA